MNSLNQKFNWTCPECDHINTDDLNSTEQPYCANCHMKPRVWRIPIKQSNLTDHDWINRNTKYHAFIDNKSICGKYDQNRGFSESSTLDEEEMKKNPHLACKSCLELVSNYYCNNCRNGRYFYNEVSVKGIKMIDNKQGKQHGIIMHIDPTNITKLYEPIYCYKCKTQVSDPIYNVGSEKATGKGGERNG
ncbi:hypothetical protein [Bacillus safensis]|uniref:hypothetical protein n=1 Tax=Bacillus safensis TaxID=561879 RepID=UPI00366A7E0F